MTLIWYISIETAQKVLHLEECKTTLEYFPCLFRAARLVDEKVTGGFVRVLSPARKGHRLGAEWDIESGHHIYKGKILKYLAVAAREAGLNYE